MAEPNINTAATVGSITTTTATAAATTTTLDLLQAFHRHVLALADGRAESLDALAPDRVSDTFVAELAKIWQPAPKNEREREIVRSATIPIDGTQYSISDEFRDVTLALSDEVEVAELEAARCALDAQQDLIPLGRPLLQCAVIRYHQQRKYVLDALRVLMDLDNQAEEDRSDLLDAVKQFVQQRIFPPPPPSENPTSAPPRRSESGAGAGTSTGKPAPDLCMSAIGYVRALLRKVSDKLLAVSMLGQDRLAELEAEMHTLEYTRAVLYQQHELIGIIMSRCIARRQPELPDFTPLLDMLRRADRYDALLVHMIPALAAHISLRAFTGDWSRFQDAREMHAVICGGPRDEDALTWPLPYLQAAVKAWWLAEYSGFFAEEPPEGRIPPSVNMDQEDKQKTKGFSDALKEGAFDFFLAVAADVKAQEWQDPARAGMRQWLQRKTPALAPEWTRFEPFFKICLMQHIETFVDAAISNLPDVLRRLRVEEDEQRQLSQTHEHDLDLERFLIVIAYTYEDRPDAAMAFWSDPDANLAGFMHWASRRASTPLVSAFCEMLGAISETAPCAEAAHEFLLDEGRHASGKMRRTQSLTWTQIIRELIFFSDKIRERPAAAAVSVPSTTSRLAAADHQAEAEPESAMMLECYLRLMTRLASGSESARQFLLQEGTTNVTDLLFQLAGSPVPARLRACVFTTLQALLTRKSYDDGLMMWNCLDGWMTGAYSAHGSHLYHHSHHNPHYFPHHNWAAAAQPPSPSATMERIFDDLGPGFEEPLAFVQLLTALVVPSEDDNPLNDALQFPENLGAAVRAPGIDMYVDFVLGRVFAGPAQPEDQNRTRMLRLACLQFALACLNTFNENLIVLANGTNIDVDNCIVTTDLATYVRLHPFGRVMEWMLTDQVMTALFGTIHQQDTAEAGSSAPESPLIQAVLCAVEVISKVLELQPTYLDLVRPMIARPPPPPQQHRQQQQQPPQQQPHMQQQQQQQQRSQRRGLAAAASAAAASASLEDGLITHLGLVVDLGVYCGMGHADLTLACLRLLKTMSESLRISSGWSTSTTITAGPGGGDGGGRNKAIVAMEADGEHEQIAQALITELRAPLPQGSLDSAGYQIKIHILDFLLACLCQSPRRPTIAHLLLGFRCGVDSLSADPRGAFDSQTSLFHALLQFLVETPVRDGGAGAGADDQSSSPSAGIRQWTAALRARAVAVLRILWTSPLSAPLVVPELRLNEFLFHLLLGETVIRPNLAWEGTSVEHPFFCTSDGAGALADFLSARAASLDYMAMELCSVAQGGGLPALKRRVLEALVNGQLRGEDGGGSGGDRIAVPVPTVFDLFDFQLPPDAWDLPPPPVDFYRGLDLECCREDEEDDEVGAGDGGSGDRPAGPVRCRYNLNRVREILLLRLAEYRAVSESNQVVVADQELVMIDREDDMITAFLRGANRRSQIVAEGLRVLRAWTRLLLVMVECNDFGGTARTSFFLQALQAILPSLELCASDRPAEAIEIAAVARILLFKLDLASSSFPSDAPSEATLADFKGGRTRRSGISSSSSNLVSERLYQLFQICVAALARRAGDPRLRAVYYSICYRYVAGAAAASAASAAAAAAPPATAALTDEPDAPLIAAAAATRHRAANVVHLYGDKLLNVICDDACGGDVACQTAALVLLAGLVGMAIREGDFWVIEIMNRLNFVGVLVDSLRNVLEEWMLAVDSGSEEAQNYHNAKLALLLLLAQTRDGAQHIINANLFRSLQLSGLFAADPELQANPENPHTLERLYHLLASVARIVSAAIVSRGSHNIIQGQRFLRENRSLVSHTLKRSAGVGPATAAPLEVKLWDLTEALIVLITATDFLESEEKELAEIKQKSIPFFH